MSQSDKLLKITLLNNRIKRRRRFIRLFNTMKNNQFVSHYTVGELNYKNH